MAPIVAVLVIAAIVYAVWRNGGLRALGGGSGLRCNWRRDPTHKTGGARRYVCRKCGADAFTRDGAPPRNCQRAARSL